jgi:integrase
MASVYEKNGRYYIRYKDERGRWCDRASAARTKTEARRLADDFERRCERVRLGLEQPLVTSSDRTIAEILTWWLEEVWKGRPSYKKARSAIRCHLLEAPFAGKQPGACTAGEIERYLDSKTRTPGKKGKPLGPHAVNHLRTFLRRAFGAAIKDKLIPAPNLMDDVKLWKAPKRKADFLRLHEVALVLRQIRPHWRALFATAIYAGLRKGELFGLRKCDVDFDLRLILVRRSYDRDVTKGEHEDGVPMATELLPYLRDAVDRSPSDLVFPRTDGSMYAQTTQLEQVLRRALRRAGIIVGYRHKCRARGCGNVIAATDGTLRRCPKDNRVMWVTSVVRPIRFHDLRHTTGSLLTMRGANVQSVQRILRHSDPRITTEIYCHLDPDYLRREIDLLAFDSPSDRAPSQPAQASAAGASKDPLAAILLLASEEGGSEGAPTSPPPSVLTPTSSGAGYRVRTDDIQLGKLTLYQLS